MIAPTSLTLASQDTVTAARAKIADTIAVGTPVDDPITPIIQWIFQRSPFVMWGGVVVGLVVAVLLLRWLWPRRQTILQRLAASSTPIKVGLVGAAVLAVMVAGFAGVQGYHFMETDRRFCNGCHIFVPSGQPWVHPDTGYYSLVPKLEGKHDTINCHTCHTLKPLKEGVKMVFWMSGVRGDRIPEHGKVPREICEGCHIQGAARETWQAIATTAGHRTHLESDSSALKDKVECLTCHARTAHRFQPADTTCVQKGCHLTDDTRIALGKMRGQSDLHCTLCHEFARPVALLATRDSAAGALRPGMQECLSCHRMKDALPGFTSVADPHGGTCGTCHNPHEQKLATDTRSSCASAGCHADWKKIPFHVGAPHRRQGEQCILCHNPHSSRVDASDCAGCHEGVKQRPGGHWLAPPLPFDTLKALRSMAPTPPPEPEPAPERPSKVKGDAPPGDDHPPSPPRAATAEPSDTFSHPIHTKLACLTCHLSTSGAALTFESPRGCQICHHQSPAKADCTSCHQRDDLPVVTAVPVVVAAAGKPARDRTVGFKHEAHDKVKCVACHGTPVTLAAVDSALSCQGCHADHHAADRDCATCHRTAQITEAHARPARVHSGCDACHATEKVASLSPTRSLCLTCHGDAVDHHPERQCSLCHLQASPEDYRPRLLKARSAR